MSEADEATPTGAPSASTGPPGTPKSPGPSTGGESPRAAAADRVDGDAVPKAAEATGSDGAEPKVISRRMTGTVKWFNVKEGYGFISRSDTHGDVFVHQSAISRNNPGKYRRSVGEGETVEFDLVRSERGTEAAEVTGPAGTAVEGSRYARERPRARRGSHSCYPAAAPSPPGSDPAPAPARPDQQADGGRARLSPGSPSCPRARARGPRGRDHPEADDHSRAPADRAPCHRGAHDQRLSPAPAPARSPRGAEDTDEDKAAADHPRAPHAYSSQRRVTYRCVHTAKSPEAARDEGAPDTERPLRPEWAITTGRCLVSSCGTRSAQHRDLDKDQALQDSATFGCSSDVRRRAAPRGPRWPSDHGADQAAAAESRHYPRAFAMRPRGRTQRPAVPAKAEPAMHAGEDTFATAQGPRRRAPDKAPEEHARRFPPPRRAPAEPRRPRPAGSPRAAHHPWSPQAAGPPRVGPGPSCAWPSQARGRHTIPGPRGSASTSQKPEARVVGSCWDTSTLQCIPLLRYGPSACRGLRCRPQSPPEAPVCDPKGTEDEIQAPPAETPGPPSEKQSASSEGPTSTLAAD